MTPGKKTRASFSSPNASPTTGGKQDEDGGSCAKEDDIEHVTAPQSRSKGKWAVKGGKKVRISKVTVLHEKTLNTTSVLGL